MISSSVLPFCRQAMSFFSHRSLNTVQSVFPEYMFDINTDSLNSWWSQVKMPLCLYILLSIPQTGFLTNQQWTTSYYTTSTIIRQCFWGLTLDLSSISCKKLRVPVYVHCLKLWSKNYTAWNLISGGNIIGTSLPFPSHTL